jgi:hypothetical protein
MSFFYNDHPHPHQSPRRQFVKKGFSFSERWRPLPRFRVVCESASQLLILPIDRPTGFNNPLPVQPRRIRQKWAPERWSMPTCTARVNSGEVWQWYPLTKTFDEFAHYLDRTGVQQGIINNVRCQLAKTPKDFIEGNREVARYVEKYKGRFLGSCVVNPIFIDEDLREIENCRRELGFVWVGELCNYTVPYQYTI